MPHLKIFVWKIYSSQHNKGQCNKGREINIFRNTILQIHNYLISLPAKPESIKITFKNNRTKKNSDCFWTQPIENITSISSQKPNSSYKHCRLVWGVENNHLIKLKELIYQHFTCCTRIETITFHRTIAQHHNANQAENDGRIPKCFDTAVLIFLSSSPE